LRIEKKQRWSDEINHEYHYLDGRVVIDVDERGIADIRDRDGRLIHVQHLLELVDVAKLVDHDKKHGQQFNPAQEVTA